MKLRRKKASTKVKLFTHLSLPMVRRPKWADNLTFPNDITELSAANVSELLGKYTYLWSYANQDMSNLSQELLRLEALEQLQINKCLKERPALNGIDKFRRESLIAMDDKIEAYRKERKVLHMKQAATRHFLENYDRYITALSRELTRKSSLEERGPRYAANR